MKNIKVELPVRTSAATKNIMIALVFAIVSCSCYAFDLVILSIVAIGLAAVFAVMSLTCVFDVQEQNMRLLNELVNKANNKKKEK